MTGSVKTDDTLTGSKNFLEKFADKMQAKGEELSNKKIVLNSELAEKKANTNAKQVLKDALQGKKPKNSFITRIITQTLLFLFNYWVFNVFISWWGYEQTIFIILTIIATTAGYIAYQIMQGAN